MSFIDAAGFSSKLNFSIVLTATILFDSKTLNRLLMPKKVKGNGRKIYRRQSLQ